MSEELRSSGQVEEQETRKSGLLLSVDPLRPQTKLSAKDGDNIDTDTDGTDKLVDSDGTDAGTDSDGTDTTKDSDGRD